MNKPAFANNYQTTASEMLRLSTECSNQQRGGSDKPSCLLSTLWGSWAMVARSAAKLLELPQAALPPLQLLLPTPGPPTAKQTAVPAQCSGWDGNKGWE